MSEAGAIAKPLNGLGRVWAFAALALVLAPAFAYGFGLVTQMAIVDVIPLVALGLLAVSGLLGLWTRGYGLAVKAGAVVWIALLSLGAPVMLLLGFCYAGALMHFHGSCM